MTIKIFPSAMEGEPLEVHEVAAPVILTEWLKDKAPGFDPEQEHHPIGVRVNGADVLLPEWSQVEITPASDVEIRVEPKASAAMIIVAAVVVSAVVAYVMARGAKTPQERAKGKSLGDGGVAANNSRYGEPVPEIAGSPIFYPPLLAPPFSRYLGERVQWSYALLCLGRGDFQVSASDFKVGGTPANLLGDSAAVKVYGPGESLDGDPAAEIWYSPSEVGFTTFGGSGMTLGTVRSVSTRWDGTKGVDGVSIYSSSAMPGSWQAGMKVVLEVETEMALDDDWISSPMLDAINISVGDSINVQSAQVDDDFFVSSITPGVVSSEGQLASVKGSQPPDLDFSAGVAFTVKLGQVSYAIELTRAYSTRENLVAAILSQLNGTLLTATLEDGRVVLEQLPPADGRSLSLSGDYDGVMGSSPIFTEGSSAVVSQPAKYHLTGARFGAEDTRGITGRTGYIYEIDSKAQDGRSINVVPESGTGWSGFPEGSSLDGVVYLSQESYSIGWSGPFVATPGGEKSDMFEVDIFYPQGLVGYHRKKGRQESRSAGGTIQWRYIGDTEWQSVQFSFRKSQPNQWGFTRRVVLPKDGRVEVRVRSYSSPSTSTNTSDTQQWTGLRSRLVSSKRSYPGWTVATVAIRSGDDVSASVENKVSVRARRKLPTLESAQSQVTRDIAPFFLYALESVGYGRDMVDMPRLEALHTLWSERKDTFDLVIDSESTLKTVLGYCLGAGFAELTIRDGLITPVRDSKRIGPPSRIFSPQEYTRQLDEVTEVVRADDVDGVDVEYIDHDTGKVMTQRYRLPEDLGHRVETIKAPGVTGRTQAWRLAARRRRVLAYRRTQYQGSTELHAMNANYMDYVGLQDGIPEYGQSAFVVAVSDDGERITLSEKIEQQEGFFMASIRRPDGTATPPAYVALQADERTITFIESIGEEVTYSTGEGGAEPTAVYIGTINRVMHGTLMQEVRPSADGVVSFKAVAYDERIYAEDDETPYGALGVSSVAVEGVKKIRLLERYTGRPESTSSSVSVIMIYKKSLLKEPAPGVERQSSSAAITSIFKEGLSRKGDPGVERQSSSAAITSIFKEGLKRRGEPGVERQNSSDLVTLIKKTTSPMHELWKPDGQSSKALIKSIVKKSDARKVSGELKTATGLSRVVSRAAVAESFAAADWQQAGVTVRSILSEHPDFLGESEKAGAEVAIKAIASERLSVKNAKTKDRIDAGAAVTGIKSNA